MAIHLQLLAASTALHLLMIVVAATLGARLYTLSGLLWASGARDKPLGGPAPSLTVFRADRAAKNMTENMVFFTPVLLAGHVAGVDPAVLGLGAKLFFFARLVYWPIYLLGIPYIRTLCWTVNLIGIGIIAAAIL